jgi:zinc transporter, ZIP family
VAIGGPLGSGRRIVAAGAILAMLVDTMIPEAVKVTRSWTGIIALLGFILAFAISMLSD